LLAFLAKRTGRSLTLLKKPQGKGRTIKSQTDAVASLLKAAQKAESISARRALVAKLIATLYGMPLEQVLELDRSCVDTSDAELKIRLGGDWVTVEKPVASLLREVTVLVGNMQKSRLFPGRLSGDSLSTAGVEYYFRRISVS
jgi:hypothetical protein